MTQRTKKVLLPTGITLEQANDAFADYNEASKREAAINNRILNELNALKDRHQAELEMIAETKKNSFDLLQAYAINNRDTFGKKKSLSLLHGVIGFRTGTPKLKLKKGYSWESALELIKAHLKGYVITAETVDKKKLLADRDLEAVKLKMPSCGVLVDQDESFYVEPIAELAKVA